MGAARLLPFNHNADRKKLPQLTQNLVISVIIVLIFAIMITNREFVGIPLPWGSKQRRAPESETQ